MNIHKINSHLHQSFLEEERKDAITGDLIQANDEVVFCGICKSAFLKDSWEYMDRKHCGQTKTLSFLPISVPLLLNVSIINPHFITLVNTSISFDECLKLLSNFNPRDKKVEILLNPNLKKALEKSIEKPKPQIRHVKEQEQQDVQRRNKKKTLQEWLFIIFASVILGMPIGVFTSLVFDSVFIRLLISGSSILISYFLLLSNSDLIFKNQRKKTIQQLPIENRVSLENSKKEEQQEKFKIKDLASFGIFNHSLFFYFEQLKQGVFIELTRINDIEIQYQSSCCVNLILKKQDSKNEEVSIPLIFSKKERITTFLLRLAKTKKNSTNHTEVKLTNFPIDRIRLLKRKLLLYVDFTFIEPKKIESKEPEYKKIVSSQDKTIINGINQEINPKDLSKLEKSQKVSKESQNRNQHHQNRHQTQYKNYKRR